MAPPRRTFPVAVLLVAAGGAWCALAWRPFTTAGVPAGAQLVAALLAAGVAAVPAARNGIARGLNVLRYPSPPTRQRIMGGVFAAAALYLAATAYFHGRDLAPRVHDECSYALGARLLARGRLWMPPHELADFFESFHVLARPVYASIYFPGTALLNAPAVWLGLPWWVVPVLLAGGVVALAYRVTAELLDGAAGLLAALLVVATTRFRMFSVMVMAPIPAALLGLLVLWAWLKWRDGRRARWAAAVGAFAGWAAITRPVDAVAFAAPVGLAMGWNLWRVGIASRMEWARTAAALVAGAAPFLAVQLVFDLGVTGRPLKTPYVLYLEQNQPGSVFGAAAPADPAAAVPAGTSLPQKREYYRQLVADEAEMRGRGKVAWVWHRLMRTVVTTLPSPLLLIPLPLVLLGVWRWPRRRWVVLAVPPACFGLYLLNPFYLDHYALPLLPPVIFAVLAGAGVMTANGSPVWNRFAAAFLFLSVAAVGLLNLPELNPAPPPHPPYARDEPYVTPLLYVVDQKLADVRPPAVVLFRYGPLSSVHEEPVYNLDAARPDDAPVMRAHDLGPRNGELFRYYAARQPGRTFYLFDRGDLSLTELGTADKAAARLAAHDAARGTPPP